MFEMIRRWLGISPDKGDAPKDAFQQLSDLVPLKSAPEESTAANAEEKHSFICREEVLSRDEHIDGYEFSLSRRLQSRMQKKSVLAQRLHDEATLRNLAWSGVASLLGHRFALIHLSPNSLKNPLLEAFSGINVVIMVTPDEVTTIDPEETCDDLLRLGEIGIKYGWTLNRSCPAIPEFLPETDFIEVESTAFDGLQMKMMCREFRAIKRRPKLIASELQTFDDFNLCYQCGFDYFTGPFTASRENWQPAKSDINRLRVFEVLNMIRAGAEFDAIANRLRTEPVLTFKLLRYINSASIGLQQKISEIPQALLVLGSERFYRWLSLLLFDFNQLGYRERVLNEQVLARARFLEMLSGHGRIPAAADQLFITGLFSLMDVMMGRPLAEVLKQVSLPEPVVAALKGEHGPMRDALSLAIAVESGTPEEMETAAVRCGLDVTVVTDTTIKALAWSQQMSAVGE